MPRYKLTFSYDGTRFCGWQKQKTALSIQEVMQEAFSIYFRQTILITGAGRTDAGVHALSQTAHFDAPTIEPRRFLYAMNALLPPDIRIQEVEEAASFFHARYSAMGKVYRYQIALLDDPFTYRYEWHVRYPLSRELLETAAKKLLGTHDFKGFANHAGEGIASYDSVRTLSCVDISYDARKIFIEFEGDGFLRQMVRNCVGTLVDIARGYLPLSVIDEIFASQDRRKGGQSAPAKGLFLVKVLY